MSRSPSSSKNRSKSDLEDSPKSKSRSDIEYQDESPNDERERIRRKLTQDATDLLDYVTIEMTVGSQMESTKKNIREMAKRCREESRMINDLERQIEEESLKKDKIENGEEFDSDDRDSKEIDVILELEKELKLLYEEKAALLNSKKKK